MSSAVLGFGQEPVLPEHPLIVKRLALRDQSQTLGTLDAPIPLFTPTHNGLYRITAYVQAVGNPAMVCSGFCILVEAVFAPNAERQIASFGYNYTTAVPGISGQVIGYSGLITSTTAATIHRQNETRMFSVDIDDSKEQTHAIIMAAAGFSKKKPANLRPWHAFHELLSISDKRVVVPFAEELAGLVLPVATRLRRDFPAFLAVIETTRLSIRHRGSKTGRPWQLSKTTQQPKHLSGT